jgi:ribose transport system permease protein
VSEAQGLASRKSDRADASAVRSERVFDFINRYLLVMILVGLCIGFSIALPASFFTVDNFKTTANEQVVVVLLAMGATLPLIVGEFDLSIGYVLGLGQALAVGFIINQGLGIAGSIILTLIISGMVGFLNGIMIVKFHISSLIATLATGSILTGFVFWYTGGQVLYGGVPNGYVNIARGEAAGLPLPVWYGLAIVVVLAAFYSFVPTGRRMYAIGGNRQAALLSGIKVDRLIIASFVGSSVLSGFAGVLISARLGSAQPGLGPDFLLPAFAAAFLGATTIRPGRFNLPGTVIAVYTLAIAITGLQQEGVPSWFEYVFNGVALIVAVGLSNQVAQLRQSRARRRRLQAFSGRAAEGSPVEVTPVAAGPPGGAPRGNP